MMRTAKSEEFITLAASDGRKLPVSDPASPLAVAGLTVAYQRNPVLLNISYTAPNGRLIAIVGPNGAGKSTFLKASLALIPRLAGEVTVFGKPISNNLKRVAYVPQRTSVDWEFPANVLDVVMMGLYGKIGWLRWPVKKHREEALACLSQVGMENFQDRQIGQLSGGQQQRVFLARALAEKADVLLMDEPFSGVDAATEHSIINVLKQLNELNKTVIVVHHDLETVTTYFDHVLILNKQVIASGEVSQVFTEDNLHKAYGGRLAQSQLSLVG